MLRWLRQQIDRRGENTSSLALKLGRPKTDVRKVLTGAEPLTVDDLVRITELLGLSEDDLGVSATVRSALAEGEAAAGEPEDDHWDNQPRALFQFGFDRGIDFMFLASADELGEWGGPPRVLEQYKGRELPLQLDAAWHKHMKPEFSDDGLSISLSFDGLYRCYFAWSAVRRVIFMPFPPNPEQQPAAPTPGPTLVGGGSGTTSKPAASRPHLRLVK